MSKKIKSVKMNGVELRNRGDYYSDNDSLMYVMNANIAGLEKAGLVTIEYEPEMVRCSHWGALNCIGEQCEDYMPHVTNSDCSRVYCLYVRKYVTCTPNAPGWAAGHEIKLPKIDHELAKQVFEATKSCRPKPVEVNTGLPAEAKECERNNRTNSQRITELEKQVTVLMAKEVGK